MIDTALRIYFAHGLRAKGGSFFRRLFAPSVASTVLRAAQKENIAQAVAYGISAGYLRGEQPSIDHHEITPARHPQCIELLDTETRLRAFVESHQELLTGTDLVFLKAVAELAAPNGRR